MIKKKFFLKEKKNVHSGCELHATWPKIWQLCWVYNHNHRMSGSQLISTFWDQLSSLLPTISSRTSSFILSNHTYISTFYLFIYLFIFPNMNNWAILCTARDPTPNKQKLWKIMAIWWLGIKCLIWNYNNLEVGYWWV